jgi:hypothetical protein
MPSGLFTLLPSDQLAFPAAVQLLDTTFILS